MSHVSILKTSLASRPVHACMHAVSSYILRATTDSTTHGHMHAVLLSSAKQPFCRSDLDGDQLGRSSAVNILTLNTGRTLFLCLVFRKKPCMKLVYQSERTTSKVYMISIPFCCSSFYAVSFTKVFSRR